MRHALALLLLAPAAAAAWELGPGAPYTRDTYPVELTLRPLTFPAGLVEVVADGASSPSSGRGPVTYAHGGAAARLGLTDDVRLEVTGGVSSCTDCPSSFPERGVGGGAALRVSVFRTNRQQLALTAGGSATDWKIAGTKATFEGSLLHDVAFGPFALVSRLATLHGDRAWGLSAELEPQLQLAPRLALVVSTSVLFADAQGLATGRNPTPLAVGASFVAYAGRDVRHVDVGASYGRSNAFATGAAVDRGSGSGYVRVAW